MQRRGPRVIGVYSDRANRSRVVYVGEDGQKRSRSFKTRRLADGYADKFSEAVKQPPRITVSEAIGEYLQNRPDLRPASVKGYGTALRDFFREDLGGQLVDIDETRAAELYREYVERPATRGGKPRKRAAASHHHALRVASIFCNWATEKPRRYLAANPFAEVQKVDVANRRKKQLRLTETIAFWDAALRHVEQKDGAVAVLVILSCGMRSAEVLGLTARDVDDGGRWLCSDDGKTGPRENYVDEEVLQRHLVRLAAGKAPGDRLWSCRSHQWLCRWTKQICLEAGVPVVTPQGLRGTRETLALRAGRRPQEVAAEQGHSVRVQQQHYAEPGAAEMGKTKSFLRVLAGGRR